MLFFYGIDVDDLCVDFVVLNNGYEEELDREKEIIFLE